MTAELLRKKLLAGLGLTLFLTGLFLVVQAVTFLPNSPATGWSASGGNTFSPVPTPTSISAVAGLSTQSQRELFIEPEAGKAPVLNAINSADKSINLVIYALSDPEILASLCSASERGIAVRVIYNYYQFPNYTSRQKNQNSADYLNKCGVNTKKASKRFTFTHQKTLIIDKREAEVLTLNLESSYFTGSRDFGILTDDPKEVAEILAIFEADWQDQGFSPTVSSLIWSPNNSRGKLLKLISQANKSLDIYAEVLEDNQVVEALISSAQRKVMIRVICAKLKDNGCDSDDPPRQKLLQVGISLKTDSLLFTHAKMVLADYGYQGALVFLGSENFSSTSLDKNRELGMIISDLNILDKLAEVFNADWK